MENRTQLNYRAFHVHAVNEDDAEFLTESINSFSKIGGKLHSVVPKTEKGTTTGYIVVVEFEE